MPSWDVYASKVEVDHLVIEAEDEDEAWEEADYQVKNRLGYSWLLDDVKRQPEPEEPTDAK